MSKCICGHEKDRHWNNGFGNLDTHCVLSLHCDCPKFFPEMPDPRTYYHALARYEESIRPEGVEDFLEEFIPLVNRYASKEAK